MLSSNKASAGARPQTRSTRRAATPVAAAVLVAALTAARPLAAEEGDPAAVRTVLAPGVHHFRMTLQAPAKDVNVAVVSPSAAVELKAVAGGAGGGGPGAGTVSELCLRHQCLVAVNGDMSGARGRPLGGLVSDGRVVVPMPSPPVPAHWQVSVDGGGGLAVGLAPPPAAAQSAGASYPLLLDGAPQVIAEESSFTHRRHPRTFIGWSAARGVLLVTVDGRSARSRGLTLAEGASLMASLGATTAVNLDGGGSTTFVVNGRVVNTPSDGKERRVASAWVVVPKQTPPPPDPAGDGRGTIVVLQADFDEPAVVAPDHAAVPPRWSWLALALVLVVAAGHRRAARRPCTSRRTIRTPATDLPAGGPVGGESVRLPNLE